MITSLYASAPREIDSRTVAALDLAVGAGRLERAAAVAPFVRDRIVRGQTEFVALPLIDRLPADLRIGIAHRAARDAHIAAIRAHSSAHDRSWIITGSLYTATGEDDAERGSSRAFTPAEMAEYAAEVGAGAVDVALGDKHTQQERLLLFKTNAHGEAVAVNDVFAADLERGVIITQADSMYDLPLVPTDAQKRVRVTGDALRHIETLRHERSPIGEPTITLGALLEQRCAAGVTGPCLQVELGSAADPDLGTLVAARISHAAKLKHPRRDVAVNAMSRAFVRNIPASLLSDTPIYRSVANIRHVRIMRLEKSLVHEEEPYREIVRDGETTTDLNVTGHEDLTVAAYADFHRGTIMTTYGTERRQACTIAFPENER